MTRPPIEDLDRKYGAATPRRLMPLDGTEHVDTYDNRPTVIFRLMQVGGYIYTTVKALPSGEFAIRRNGESEWSIHDRNAASEQFLPWLEYQWARMAADDALGDPDD